MFFAVSCRRRLGLEQKLHKNRDDRKKLTSLDFFAGFNAKKLAVRIEK